MTLIDINLFWAWLAIISVIWAALCWYCYTLGWYKGRVIGIRLANDIWTKGSAEQIAADRQKFIKRVS